MRIGTELIVIFLLILANGVFAMSEIAVVAARKVRLQQRAEDGDERAKAALALAHDPNKFLSTVQFGITLVGVLAGAYGGANIAARLEAPIATVPQLAPYAEGLALALVVSAITVLSLIVGELVPKRIGLNNPEAIASWVARPMMMLSKVGGPAVGALTSATNLVLRVFGVKGQAEPNLTEDEIKALISQGAETGAVGATEENIVQRVFQLGDQRVAAIMTPRPDIEWIDVDATEEELREFLASHSHTQFVVCHGGLDEVLGIVRSADLLPIAFKGSRIDLRSLVREALFVPDSMPAVQLLESFRSSHKHVALVMDEYGAVEGLVTVTDLLTAIVGDLPADASEAQGEFVSRADGSWLVDGSAAMDEVTAHFGMDSLPEEESGAYHTIGGFVMARLGRVPKAADAFEWGGMRFEVMDMDGRRIDKVLVTRKPG
ncbi:MAG TPA: hemolysin family protein [Vicinamibacterales bacterium]|nr:hemolysin family protein [Vicinamibacterales bacterium]